MQWLDLSTFTTLVSVEPKLTIETRNRVLKSAFVSPSRDALCLGEIIMVYLSRCADTNPEVRKTFVQCRFLICFSVYPFHYRVKPKVELLRQSCVATVILCASELWQISYLRTEQTQLSKSLEKERQRAAENRQEYLTLKEETKTHEGHVIQLEEEIKEMKRKHKQELHESLTHRELLQQLDSPLFLAEHEDIDDVVGSEEPTECDHGPAAATNQDGFLRQPSKMKPTLEDEDQQSHTTIAVT
ncbi:hypothetical protein OROMI_015866 [Orobanche minor]